MYYFVDGEYFILANIKIISGLLLSHILNFIVQQYDSRWKMWEINVRENQRAIKNEQSGDTDNTEYTRHRMKTNKTKTTAIKHNIEN